MDVIIISGFGVATALDNESTRCASSGEAAAKQSTLRW